MADVFRIIFIVVASFLPSYVTSRTSYTAVYSFGDSWADTGNTYHLFKSKNTSTNCMKPPYGEDFSGNSNGRCSNGRLIIDFIAEHLGLPHVKPYFGIEMGNVTETSIHNGVNFAISGATALDPSFFVKKGIPFPKGYCLKDQLDWFNKFLPSLGASPSKYRKVLKNSLFLMGEIGGNDYLFVCGARRGRKELTSMVPEVINATISAAKELIHLGAVTLLVPGTIPIGCNSIVLTVYESTPKKEYDQFGCLKWFNKFAEHHNQQLQIELNHLRRHYPHVNVFYGDYYNALLKLVHAPNKFEHVDGHGLVPLKCCCGGRGLYDYNLIVQCGDSRAKVCADPSRYVYWDGAHLTEAGYSLIAKSLLSKKPFATILEARDTTYLSS